MTVNAAGPASMRQRLVDIDVDGGIRTKVLTGDVSAVDNIVVSACAPSLQCGIVSISVSTNVDDSVLAVARASVSGAFHLSMDAD